MDRKKPTVIAGLAITAMIAYGAFSLIGVLDQLKETESLSAQLNAEIEAVQNENSSIIYLTSNLDSDSEKEKLARERLGLVKPGEIVFVNQRG